MEDEEYVLEVTWIDFHVQLDQPDLLTGFGISIFVLRFSSFRPRRLPTEFLAKQIRFSSIFFHPLPELSSISLRNTVQS